MKLLDSLIVLLCPVSTVFQFGVHSGLSIWLHQCFVLLRDQPFHFCSMYRERTCNLVYCVHSLSLCCIVQLFFTIYLTPCYYIVVVENKTL